MRLRVARHTDDLAAVVEFYRDRVGLPEIGRFTDHEGYDGVFLDLPGTGAHLEFTTGGAHPAPHPHPESLLVLYFDDERAIGEIVERVGQAPVVPANPYWRRHATTLADPDGCHLVLVGPPSVEIEPMDPTHPDARFCIEAYFAELDRRSESGFDAAAGITAEPHELRPPAGVLLVAHLGAEPVGCGALKHHADAPSEIKRMWVAESVRGLGVGRRLLAELEGRAAAAGARTVRLETNRALTEAIAMYRKAGYREVPPFNDEPFAHHWFEKQL